MVYVLLIGLLLIGYAVTRLTNLTALPMFTDEAIYIRWSQIGSRDPNWRFISLTDGKQPLFTWIMMVFLKIIPDPLYAGRFVSVLAGVGSMVGIWFLARELFGKRAAWWASFLYLIYPFALFYDRMALYDSLVATFFIWSLYLGILLVRTMRLDVALILGLTLGAGMLNKSIGFISLYLLPSTLLFPPLKEPRLFPRFFRWVGLVIIATVLSQAVYGILRLSPLYHMIQQKNAVFVYPFSEWIKHPIEFFVGNMKGVIDWLQGYMTVPLLLAALGSILLRREKLKEYLLLIIYWLAPFVALASVGRVLYPRFILFMTMPLLVLAAWSIEWIMAHVRVPLWRWALLIVLLGGMIRMDYFIVTNPLYAPIPTADRGQMIDNWPAGWGVREVNAFVENEAKKGPVAIYTEGTFGLLPYAVEIYLVDHPNIEIHGVWPVTPDLPEELAQKARNKPTYFVLNESQVPPLLWPLEFIAEYQKGLREDRKLRLYRITPPAIPTPIKSSTKKS